MYFPVSPADILSHLMEQKSHLPRRTNSFVVNVFPLLIYFLNTLTIELVLDPTVSVSGMDHCRPEVFEHCKHLLLHLLLTLSCSRSFPLVSSTLTYTKNLGTRPSYQTEFFYTGIAVLHATCRNSGFLKSLDWQKGRAEMMPQQA